jgi:hypothetical protein
MAFCCLRMGSRSSAGSPMKAVERKKVSQPHEVAQTPEKLETTVLPTAASADRRAYWVAEKRTEQSELR